MRQVLRILVALALAGLVVAVAVVGLGLYNVSARAGHLPGVAWVLHTTFRQSVKLRAPPAEAVPDLSDPELIALGAGHYATACTPCHAEPDGHRPATMRAMRPVPPPIREAVEPWQPNELHWIVENGVKMSGMPAWPAAGRDDEVWAVVAWLAAVQRGDAPALPAPAPSATPTPERVRSEDTDDPPATAYCQTCHGPIARHVPRLDIQTAAYLETALRDYRSGTRPSGIMQQAVSLVSPESFADLAAHFAATPAEAAASTSAPGPGAALARRGTQEVPACTACHGPDAPEPAPDAPALAGQDRAFLAAQMKLWRDGVRSGSAKMSAAAQALTDADIDLLAAWYAALAPERNSGQ